MTGGDSDVGLSGAEAASSQPDCGRAQIPGIEGLNCIWTLGQWRRRQQVTECWVSGAWQPGLRPANRQ